MLALSSTSVSVTWVRPLEATLSSMRLRIKRRIRNGLRFILRSASGSQVISLVSAMHTLLQVHIGDYIPTLPTVSDVVWPCGSEERGDASDNRPAGRALQFLCHEFEHREHPAGPRSQEHNPPLQEQRARRL